MKGKKASNVPKCLEPGYHSFSLYITKTISGLIPTFQSSIDEVHFFSPTRINCQL